MTAFGAIVGTIITLLLILSAIITIKDKYENLTIKWIEKGERKSIAKCKRSVARVFSKLMPINYEHIGDNGYTCTLLDAYIVNIARIGVSEKYAVTVQSYDILGIFKYFRASSLEEAKEYVKQFRINLLNSITDEAI